MNFADGQRRTCRRQIFSLPSANETFADGKCLAGRRQISYRINGKYLFCHREICQFDMQPQICGLPRSGKLQCGKRGRCWGLGREKAASEIVISPPPRKSTVQKIKRKKSPRAHAKTPRSELQSDAARPARSVNAAALITFRNT